MHHTVSAPSLRATNASRAASRRPRQPDTRSCDRVLGPMTIAVGSGRGALDPTVAVILDSTRVECLFATRSILPALKHWGVPHVVVDLAAGSSATARIFQCGSVLIAQEWVGSSIESLVPEILRHVERGAGLVSLDYGLSDYPAEYLVAAGIAAVGSEISVAAATFTDTEHPISASHRSGESVPFKLPLPATRVRCRDRRARTLAVGDSEAPLLIYSSAGSGRIVQWLLSPKLWLNQYLGLAHGLDGLLWRGIVWSAPKPFVMNCVPPFVRFRFDDCYGHWKSAADFSFVEALNKRGHVPSVCVCVKSITPDGARQLAQLHRNRQVEISPHTYSPGVSLFYGDQGREYSVDRFKEIFQELADTRRRWGVSWSTILSDHDHEWSRNSVPFLLAEGIRYKMNITLPGERWSDLHTDWRPRPYGSFNYALDHLPGDLSEFFVVFNHYPTFESARCYVSERQFAYNRQGGFGEAKWDFLSGLTGTGSNDLASAAERVAAHTRVGLDGLFFGGSITHSHFTRHLSDEELEGILSRADKLLGGLEQVPASYEEIARYTEARAGTRLRYVKRTGGGIEAHLAGSSRVALRLSVFDEEDGHTVRREHEIPAFDNGCVVRIGELKHG
jgi:hypothetical protein